MGSIGGSSTTTDNGTAMLIWIISWWSSPPLTADLSFLWTLIWPSQKKNSSTSILSLKLMGRETMICFSNCWWWSITQWRCRFQAFKSWTSDIVFKNKLKTSQASWSRWPESLSETLWSEPFDGAWGTKGVISSGFMLIGRKTSLEIKLW